MFFELLFFHFQRHFSRRISVRVRTHVYIFRRMSVLRTLVYSNTRIVLGPTLRLSGATCTSTYTIYSYNVMPAIYKTLAQYWYVWHLVLDPCYSYSFVQVSTRYLTWALSQNLPRPVLLRKKKGAIDEQSRDPRRYQVCIRLPLLLLLYYYRYYC